MEISLVALASHYEHPLRELCLLETDEPTLTHIITIKGQRLQWGSLLVLYVLWVWTMRNDTYSPV